ncbi:phytanoyl-CoA dioxygenase family protein [Sphingomonas sp. IC4-52]|nr:phytanoyl-CoA dioxygenase family protein [Sphingomonas sp. IC4-52]
MSGRDALERDGFVVFDHVFTPEELGEVERLADLLLGGTLPVHQQRRLQQFMGDMAPLEGAEGNAHDGGWRQPELEYASCLQPGLLDTGVFRKCRQMAKALGGQVSRRFDHLIYKLPNSRTATPWHQDAAYSKPRFAGDATALHFWIPLQDATAENGCMHFEPGSHRALLRTHGQFTRRTGEKGFQAAETEPAGAVVCPVQRGGLTIHTPQTLHYAGPNVTLETRKVWIIQFARFGAVRLKFKQLIGLAPGRLRG